MFSGLLYESLNCLRCLQETHTTSTHYVQGRLITEDISQKLGDFGENQSQESITDTKATMDNNDLENILQVIGVAVKDQRKPGNTRAATRATMDEYRKINLVAKNAASGEIGQKFYELIVQQSGHLARVGVTLGRFANKFGSALGYIGNALSNFRKTSLESAVIHMMASLNDS